MSSRNHPKYHKYSGSRLINTSHNSCSPYLTCLDFIPTVNQPPLIPALKFEDPPTMDRRHPTQQPIEPQESGTTHTNSDMNDNSSMPIQPVPVPAAALPQPPRRRASREARVTEFLRSFPPWVHRTFVAFLILCIIYLTIWAIVLMVRLSQRENGD